MFSKKATKIDEIFTVGEDFVKFCGLLRKHAALNMVKNLVKTPRQILRGTIFLKFCFCCKVGCFSDRRNLEEFRSHLQ